MCLKFFFNKSQPVYVCDYIDSRERTPRGERQYQYGSDVKMIVQKYDDVTVLQIKRY